MDKHRRCCSRTMQQQLSKPGCRCQGRLSSRTPLSPNKHQPPSINRCVYIRMMDLICFRLSGMEAGIQVPRMAPPMPIHIRVNWIPVSLPGRRCRSTTAITYATINSYLFSAKQKKADPSKEPALIDQTKTYLHVNARTAHRFSFFLTFRD